MIQMADSDRLLGVFCFGAAHHFRVKPLIFMTLGHQLINLKEQKTRILTGRGAGFCTSLDFLKRHIFL